MANERKVQSEQTAAVKRLQKRNRLPKIGEPDLNHLGSQLKVAPRRPRPTYPIRLRQPGSPPAPKD